MTGPLTSVNNYLLSLGILSINPLIFRKTSEWGQRIKSVRLTNLTLSGSIVWWKSKYHFNCEHRLENVCSPDSTQ